MSQSNQKKRNRRLIYLIIIIIALIAALTVGVVAKYIQTNKRDIVSKADEFHFASDLLKEGGADYELSPDTDKVTIFLRNFEDEWRVSQADITYDVYLDGVKIVENGVIGQSEAQDEITIDVERGSSYTVKAVATAPYSKELSATFTVRDYNMNVYKQLEDFGHYVVLTVYTKDFSGKVEVSFPEALIPDGTDQKFAGTNNYDGGNYIAGTVATPLEIGAYSSVTYRFFKVDPEDSYTQEQFAVSIIS